MQQLPVGLGSGGSQLTPTAGLVTEMAAAQVL